MRATSCFTNHFVSFSVKVKEFAVVGVFGVTMVDFNIYSIHQYPKVCRVLVLIEIILLFPVSRVSIGVFCVLVVEKDFQAVPRFVGNLF